MRDSAHTLMLSKLQRLFLKNVCRVHTIDMPSHNQNVQVQHAYHCYLCLIVIQITMAQEQK